MLYLTRKIGQSIMINDKIEIKVVEIKGNNIKLGIEYPKNTSVLRKEVFDSVVAENIESAKSDFNELGFFEALARQAMENKDNQPE